MLRFFLHVVDDQVFEDEEGQLAPDHDAAREIALRTIRELACEQIDQGYLNLDNYIVIAEQGGDELSRVLFSDAIDVRRTNERSQGERDAS